MQLPARGAFGVCWRKLIALSAFVTSDTTEEKALRADIAAALSKPAQVCPSRMHGNKLRSYILYGLFCFSLGRPIGKFPPAAQQLGANWI